MAGSGQAEGFCHPPRAQEHGGKAAWALMELCGYTAEGGRGPCCGAHDCHQEQQGALLHPREQEEPEVRLPHHLPWLGKLTHLSQPLSTSPIKWTPQPLHRTALSGSPGKVPGTQHIALPTAFGPWAHVSSPSPRDFLNSMARSKKPLLPW